MEPKNGTTAKKQTATATELPKRAVDKPPKERGSVTPHRGPRTVQVVFFGIFLIG